MQIWLYLVNNVIFKCSQCHNGFIRMFSIPFRQAMLHIHACLIYVGHLFENWCTILHYLFHHLFCFWRKNALIKWQIDNKSTKAANFCFKCFKWVSTRGFSFWNPLSPFVKTTNTCNVKFNDLLVLDEMNCNQQWISSWISFGFFFCLVSFWNGLHTKTK